ASGSSSVVVSRSWNSSTSTPYSRIRSTNASNSCRARRTQITSSNSSSWQFDGDSRSCARSGRCTITVWSFPTSECAPRTAVSVIVLMRPLLSRSTRGGSDADEGADDDEDGGQVRPDELEIAVVADLRKREAAHDHRRRRG